VQNVAVASEATDDVDAVMQAARVLIGVSARSVAVVEGVVTPPQLRLLVMVASRGPLNLAAVADGMGVHPSNATRACDRLVVAGLLDRRDNPADRRNLLLALTPAGHELVERVMDQRRAAIAEILDRIPPSRRRTLAGAMRSFAAAAGEAPDRDVWSMGWTVSG
jgi:DNA-binding MarR family transcriptional regulator